MAEHLSTILVPVDFSVNTDTALEKCIGLCAKGGSIHLLHIQRSEHSVMSFFSELFQGYSRQQLLKQKHVLTEELQKLHDMIQLKRPDVTICTWLNFGTSVEETIVRKARQITADLIIIGKNASHHFAPMLNTVVPSRIASRSGVAVLTAKPGSRQTDIRTIVVTVGKHYPHEKLQMLSALHKGKSIKIRLVSIGNGTLNAAVSKQYLIQVLRAVKQISPFPIECDALAGTNTAMELLRYCQKVGANILIVQPGAETRIKGWLSANITDALPAEAVTQILAVQPLIR